MQKKLKILHAVENYIPEVCGMQAVVQEISEFLVQQGHSVKVATSFCEGRTQSEYNGVQVESFRISGNAAVGYSFGDTERYRQFLLNSDFDVVVCFAAQQWSTDLMLPLLSEIKAKKIFVPTGLAGMYWDVYRNYYLGLKKTISDFDAIVCLSNDYRDTLFARENCARKVVVIPNAASKREFLGASKGVDVRKKYKIPAHHKLILHVGSHTAGKGHSELFDIFVKSKIKDATLLLIGGDGPCSQKCRSQRRWSRLLPFVRRGSGKRTLLADFISGLFSGEFLKSYFRGKKVLMLSLPRAEVVQLFKDADVFLFPSNIECSPIVLFEAMASGLPFISSNVGNAVEISHWFEGGGRIMPTLPRSNDVTVDIEQAALILERQDYPMKTEKFQKRVKEIWLEKFTWEIVGAAYEKLYFDICLNTDKDS